MFDRTQIPCVYAKVCKLMKTKDKRCKKRQRGHILLKTPSGGTPGTGLAGVIGLQGWRQCWREVAAERGWLCGMFETGGMVSRWPGRAARDLCYDLW